MTSRRNTIQQRAVRHTIDSVGRPLSLREIHSLAGKEVESLGYRTVSRIVSRMLADGDLAAVPMPGQPSRFESATVAKTHHHHFRCESCDRVFDIDTCPGGLNDMLPPGFTLAGHEILLWGQCTDCSKE